jgi:hypothetical protein
LHVARARKGVARRELAHLRKNDPKREPIKRNLEEALACQKELLAQRPGTPMKIAVNESELANVLVKHEPQYKLLIDTVRIACANAKSELAALVGAHLRRPAEAKRVVRNVFAAPGEVRVSAKIIIVSLAPAGTRTELHAITEMLIELNRRRLSLPGDRAGR